MDRVIEMYGKLNGDKTWARNNSGLQKHDVMILSNFLGKLFKENGDFNNIHLSNLISLSWRWGIQ